MHEVFAETCQVKCAFDQLFGPACLCTYSHLASACLYTMQAFDGGLQHKWLDFGGASNGTTWLEYRLLPTQPAVSLQRYSMTSADDEPARDPCDFVLEGSFELTSMPGALGSATGGQRNCSMQIHQSKLSAYKHFSILASCCCHTCQNKGRSVQQQLARLVTMSCCSRVGLVIL